MSNFRGFRWVLLSVVLLAAVAWVGFAVAAGPAAPTSHLLVYKADNANYFAWSLGLPDGRTMSKPRDVVVMVNTSAAQTGEYRDLELRMLRGLLSGLTPEDRVQILAVDLNAIPMTKGFVAPKGPEIDAAIAKLEGRAPLGSTDMAKALNGLIASYAGSSNPRAAIYIGDGTSKANILAPEEADGLLKSLTDQRIPVTAYAIGPALDLQLLGVLAAHSGGLLLQGNDALARPG